MDVNLTTLLMKPDNGIQPVPQTSAREFVSLLVPFYNEEKSTGTFYQGVAPILDSVEGVRFEVICVDDGSREETLPRLISLSNCNNRFQIVELSRNFGKETALTAAVDAA